VLKEKLHGPLSSFTALSHRSQNGPKNPNAKGNYRLPFPFEWASPGSNPDVAALKRKVCSAKKIKVMQIPALLNRYRTNLLTIRPIEKRSFPAVFPCAMFIRKYYLRDKPG
jgi:hypothetical protein